MNGPNAGGSYTRNEKGELVLVERTEGSAVRLKHPDDAAKESGKDSAPVADDSAAVSKTKSKG